jgi:hypothetical protein
MVKSNSAFPSKVNLIVKTADSLKPPPVDDSMFLTERTKKENKNLLLQI